MFKNQVVRSVMTSIVLMTTVSAISPISAHAMKRPNPGQGANNPGQMVANAILAAQILAVLAQTAPHLLQALQQTLNLDPELEQDDAQGQPLLQPMVLPTTPVTEQPPMRTPEGLRRVPCSSQERPLNFFMTPNSKNGRNVIYAQLPEHIDFNPKINLEGRQISQQDFRNLLRTHDRYPALIRAKTHDQYRYVGKAVSAKDPDYTAYVRFRSEGLHAQKDGASRHDRGIREGVLIWQNIFEQINPEQDLDIERWLIEELDSNWSNGLNSNGGGHKRNDEEVSVRSVWLEENCGSVAKRLRFDKRDEDDDSDGGGGSDSSSSQEASSFSACQATASEVC